MVISGCGNLMLKGRFHCTEACLKSAFQTGLFLEVRAAASSGAFKMKPVKSSENRFPLIVVRWVSPAGPIRGCLPLCA
jgi:hypothetical protein